nr:MAG TPA: hypothetical protein [Inoviridae sp.]
MYYDYCWILTYIKLKYFMNAFNNGNKGEIIYNEKFL